MYIGHRKEIRKLTFRAFIGVNPSLWKGPMRPLCLKTTVYTVQKAVFNHPKVMATRT